MRGEEPEATTGADQPGFGAEGTEGSGAPAFLADGEVLNPGSSESGGVQPGDQTSGEGQITKPLLQKIGDWIASLFS